MDKIQESISLSDEILWDIELNRLPLEQVAYKILRLCRLTDDFESIKWINLELNWYNDNKIIKGINQSEKFQIAINNWRWVLSKNDKWEEEQKYWTSSISELESKIVSENINLSNLILPSNYQPAISSTTTEGYFSNTPLKSEFVLEKYQDVIRKVRTEQQIIQSSITQNKDILSRIINWFYNYVLSSNYKLKYSKIVDKIFDGRQTIIVDKLWADPKYNEIIKSIQNNLLSDNSNERANATHNCRRLLKQFADNIAPVDNNQLEIKIWTWKKEKTLKLWDEQYINRLKNYIKTKSKSEKFQEIVGSTLDFIWNRLDAIYNASNKWTHADVSKNEAERYVIFTYLLIADILEL